MNNSISHPPFADLELRIWKPEPAGYPVEITLEGERRLARGYLASDVLPWIPGSDPLADGRRLFDVLFADPALRLAWAEARGLAPRRRVRLWLDDQAPELHALPWELLYDGAFLSASADTPFSRYLATSAPWGGAVAERPLHVLALISNPDDLQDVYNLASLDVEVEQTILKRAFSALDEDEIQLTFLSPPATLERIEEALQTGCHILHYVGHGAFGRRRKQSALYLQNEEGYAQVVPGADFTAMLKRQSRALRLVLLAACQTAAPSTAQAYLGLGPGLVAAGVPAVVAMQGHIAIQTARKLSLAFYQRLAEHGLVDCALNEARSQLLSAGRPDAAAPVLFMRLRSAQLWSQEAETAASASPPAHQAAVAGSGAIAQTGGVAAGEAGAAIGRDVGGDVVTGHKTTLFDQRGQTVGAQTNVAGDVHGPLLSGKFDGPVAVGDRIAVTGDGNVVGDDNWVSVTKSQAAGVSVDEFLRLLGELRRAIPQAGLDPDAAEAIVADLQAAETQARKPQPKAGLILSRLRNVAELLATADGAWGMLQRLQPLAQRALEAAGQLFH